MVSPLERKNVLVVDDRSLYREGITSLFEKWDDFDVIGEASNGLEAIEFCRVWPPDIVLMDVKMPNMNGIEATRVITAENPAIAVVMLSVYMDFDDVITAIRNGARGYLLKNTHAKQLRGHLRSIVAGGSAVSDDVASVCFEFIRQVPSESVRPGGSHDAASLTDHEKQLIRLVAMGYSNREIGKRLFVGEGTVKKQVSGLLAKLGLENRVQAAVYALRSGLAE